MIEQSFKLNLLIGDQSDRAHTMIQQIDLTVATAAGKDDELNKPSGRSDRNTLVAPDPYLIKAHTQMSN